MIGPAEPQIRTLDTGTLVDRPLFGTTIGSSSVNRNETNVWIITDEKMFSPHRMKTHRNICSWSRIIDCVTAVVQLMTWWDVVLGPVAVCFDEQGGGEEETSTDDGDEGAEQQRELQGAKLPEERVRLPQRVRNLRGQRGAETCCSKL